LRCVVSELFHHTDDAHPGVKGRFVFSG
jgi:hypothetical protein